jgi:hypothetical protein
MKIQGHQSGQCLVLVVAGVIRDDVHRFLALAGQQHPLVELAGGGRIHTGALKGDRPGGLPGIDHRVDVDPVAATDGGQLPLGAFLDPGMGRTGIVSGINAIGKIDNRFIVEGIKKCGRFNEVV